MKRFSIILLCILVVLFQEVIQPALHLAYFSPTDNPSKKLIELINNAKKTIHAAVYMITDKTIADALIRAKKERKIDVQIITDKITVTSVFGKATLLHNEEIPVFFFNPAEEAKTSFFYNNTPIMHHKFALIDNLLWTGSFNWTRAASQKNHENVFLTDNREMFLSFNQQFEKLKTICTRLTKEHLTSLKEGTILQKIVLTNA